MSTLVLVLIVLLVLVGFGGYSTYGRGPYYGPGFGLVGLLIIVFLVLLLLGVVHV